MIDVDQRRPAASMWALAVAMVALQLVFSVALWWVNSVAEHVKGRRIDSAMLETAGAVRPVTLPALECCDTAPITVTTRFTAADAQLNDPAVLVVAVQDNALLAIDDVLVGGQGRMSRPVSVNSRRPLLMRTPAPLVQDGAELQLRLQRAVGFGHLRPFYVGEYDDLYRSYLALRILRSDLPVAHGVLGAFVAIFALCAAPLFGARGLLLSLSGLGASWTLQQMQMLMTDAPWGATAQGGLYMVGFLAALLFLYWFFVEWTSMFADGREGKPRSRILAALTLPWSSRDRKRLGFVVAGAILLGAAVVAIRLQQPEPMIGLQDFDRLLGFLALFILPLCLVRVLSFYWRIGLRYPIEASAFIFVLLAAVADIAMVRFLGTYGVVLDSAATFFPLALLISLAARARGIFEAATATADKLQVMVAEREQTILANVETLRQRDREAMAMQERTRIMRDMHDGFGSQLVGLLLQAKGNKLSQPELVQGIEASLADLRLVVDSLDLNLGSLSDTLGEFRRRIEPRLEAVDIALDWNVEDVGPTPGVGPEATLQVFRILQEACTNALRHGEPKRIGISLKRAGPGALVVGVTDDGKGFDAEGVRAGKGLGSMRARAGRIGGRLEVMSSAAGTRVELHLPEVIGAPAAWARCALSCLWVSPSV